MMQKIYLTHDLRTKTLICIGRRCEMFDRT